jgi:hypothetical protein
MARWCGSTAATPMTERRDCQPLRLLPGGSKRGASRSTARRLYWGLTVCRYSTSCAVGRPQTPRSCRPSTLSSMTTRICALAHSSTAKPRWRGYYTIPTLASSSMNTSRRTALSASRARLPAWRRRASRRRGSVAPIDPARAGAGSRSEILPVSPCSAERDVEPMRLRQRAPDEDRPVSEPMALGQ